MDWHGRRGGEAPDREGNHPAYLQMFIDHINPYSKGGRSQLENAAIMCRDPSLRVKVRPSAARSSTHLRTIHRLAQPAQER
jgi:5-methylcytosine-specific restriction endonuclease McrA